MFPCYCREKKASAFPRPSQLGSVPALGFMVLDFIALGFMVKGLGFRVWGLGFRVED